MEYYYDDDDDDSDRTPEEELFQHLPMPRPASPDSDGNDQDDYGPVQIVHMHQRTPEDLPPRISPSVGSSRSSPYSPRTPPARVPREDGQAQILQLPEGYHAMRVHLEGIRAGFHGFDPALDRSFEDFRAHWLANGMTNHWIDHAIYNTDPLPDSEDEEPETNAERAARETRDWIHGMNMARIAYWRLRYDAVNAGFNALYDEAVAADNELKANNRPLWNRWTAHCDNVDLLTQYGPRRAAMQLWFSELTEQPRVENAVRAMWRYDSQREEINREIRDLIILFDIDIYDYGHPIALAHPQERFVRISDDHQGATQPCTRELQYGEEVYPWNDAIVVNLEGAAVFEVPDMSDDVVDAVRRVLAAFSVQEQRALRTYPDLRAWDHWCNRQSVRTWTRHATRWMSDIRGRMPSIVDWEDFADALESMLAVLNSGEDRRLWNVVVSNMAAQGIDVDPTLGGFYPPADHSEGSDHDNDMAA